MRTSMNLKSNLNYGPQASINFTSLGVGGHSRFVRRAIKRYTCPQNCQRETTCNVYGKDVCFMKMNTKMN